MAQTISNLDSISEYVFNTDFIVKRCSINLLDRSQIFIKRCFDVFFVSLFLLVVASWLFPIIALIIRLDSKGPVFYQQLRHGRNNIPFHCLKFRSMKYNHHDHFEQASKVDQRITFIGSFLRKTSLDELPQLINVILGEMTIVGPRPHAVVMNREFSERIENFMHRHMVKPGITGLAQAKGFRGEIRNVHDMNFRLKYDLFYIKNWNLFIDFIIVMMTIKSLFLNNKNAY